MARRTVGVLTGAALVGIGALGVTVGGSEARALADSRAYELYCPGTPVGNIVLNDVVTTGTISPPAPAPGQQFSVTGYQTTLDLPSSIVSAAAALGNTDIAGTGTSRVDVSGASPSSVESDSTFAVPIPSPVPDAGLVIASPSPVATIGPFTSAGGDIQVTQNRIDLTLEVSGSILPLSCTAYPNNSASTGITSSAPHAPPISPVIATYTLPLAVSTTGLPDATHGQSYSAPLAARGGHPSYLWKLVAGSGELPRGLRVHPRAGVISGVLRNRDSGTYTFTVEVRDTDKTTRPHTQETATRVLSITVS
ncbi:MAG TPA: Ig domain-containing protein [Acidimicrobiales bacterium]|nr:Ig domain-containing protein [Acidimicrobiales bacterium]